MTEQLPRGQQIFLQRLMAEHTMTDERAEEVFQEIIGAKKPKTGMGDVDTPTECFASINQQLKRGFGLEIMTMITTGQKSTKIHAVVNADIDKIAKESYPNTIGYNERQYIRSILKELVEGPSVRSTLINLRTDTDDNNGGGDDGDNRRVQMTLDEADKCLEMLLEEHWLSLEGDATQRRRESMNAKIVLGPRAYMEMNPVLVDMGYDKEEMPQFIFHR